MTIESPCPRAIVATPFASSPEMSRITKDDERRKFRWQSGRKVDPAGTLSPSLSRLLNRLNVAGSIPPYKGHRDFVVFGLYEKVERFESRGFEGRRLNFRASVSDPERMCELRLEGPTPGDPGAGRVSATTRAGGEWPRRGSSRIAARIGRSRGGPCRVWHSSLRCSSRMNLGCAGSAARRRKWREPGPTRGCAGAFRRSG